MKLFLQKLNTKRTKRLALAALLICVAVIALVPKPAYAFLWGLFGKMGDAVISDIIASLVNMALTLASWLLWIAGLIFNYAVNKTLNMSGLLANIPVVDIGWRIIRDIANIVFIFIALWSGISITLGLRAEKAWGLLAQMVLVALFINFSLFITKAVVDGTNIAALHFYNLMKDPAASADADAGISDAFMNGLRLQTLWNSGTLGGGGSTDAAATILRAGVESETSEWNIVLVGVFGSVFLIITAFVFFAAAILFVIRAITLIMLMVLSPLAFVAWILPGASGLASKWWSTLWSQAFFAPIYMALAYVVVATIQSPAFGANLNGLTFAAVFTSTSGGAHTALIFNFLILIGLMIGCLIVAQNLGAKGSGMVMKMGKSLKGAALGAAGGFAGRFAVRGFGTESWKEKAAAGAAKLKEGKAASMGERLAMRTNKWIPNLSVRRIDERLKDSRFGKSALGDTLRRMTTGAAAQAKFGSKTSAEEAYNRDEQLRSQRDDIDRADTTVRNGIQISEREEEVKTSQLNLAALENQKEKEEKAGTSTADTEKKIAETKNNMGALELKNLEDIKQTEKEIARISARGFAELGKDLLKNPMLMRFASRAQTAAAMGSDHLTETEKDEMLEAKYHWVTEKAGEYQLGNKKYEDGVQTFRTAYATELEQITPADIDAAKNALDPALVASITQSENSKKDGLVKTLRDQGKNVIDAEIEATATTKNNIAKRIEAHAKDSLETRAKEEAEKTEGAINPFKQQPPTIDQRFRRRLRDFPIQEMEWLNRIEPEIFEKNPYLTQTIRQGTINDVGKSQAFGTEQYQVIRDRKSAGVINAADLIDGIPLRFSGLSEKESEKERGRWREFFAENPLPAELTAASLATYMSQINAEPKSKTKFDALGGALPIQQIGMLLANREEGEKRMKEALGGKAQEEQSMMPRRIWGRRSVWKYLDRGGFQTFRSKDEDEKMPVVRDMLVEELKGTLSDFNRTILRWMRTDRGGKTFYTGPLVQDGREMSYRNITSDPLILSKIEAQLRKLGKTLDDKLVVGEGDEWDKIMSGQ